MARHMAQRRSYSSALFLCSALTMQRSPYPRLSLCKALPMQGFRRVLPIACYGVRTLPTVHYEQARTTELAQHLEAARVREEVPHGQWTSPSPNPGLNLALTPALALALARCSMPRGLSGAPPCSSSRRAAGSPHLPLTTHCSPPLTTAYHLPLPLPNHCSLLTAMR